MKKRSIYIGFDPREAQAFAVARYSIIRRLSQTVMVYPLILEDLRALGWYWREHRQVNGQAFDVISEAPISTEFANSRFLVPLLARTGWALFLDSDMLVADDLVKLFEQAEQTDYAVMCVKHEYAPSESFKKDGQAQTIYARKNWSSLMLFNCDHPSNQKLTPHLINSLPGRDLHRFCWLDSEEIGALDPAWNHLVGHTEPNGRLPKVIHFTSGGPWLPAYSDVPYAHAWREELLEWARTT